MDNHYSHELFNTSFYLDDMVANANDFGLPVHWWAMPTPSHNGAVVPNNTAVVYLADPTGFGV